MKHVCVAGKMHVPFTTRLLTERAREASMELGIPFHRLCRLIDQSKPAISFKQTRKEYLLLAGYLRCSVFDLFEQVPS